MSNIDASFGLRQLTTDSGSPFSGKLRKCAVATNYGTALYRGDPVLLTGTSVVDPVDGTILPYVGRAATSGYVSGVIVDVVGAHGVSSGMTAEDTTYIPANTGGFVLIDDDPTSLFEIQADGSLAVTDIGNTADLIFTNAGSTVTGQAGAELDTADIGTGTQLVIESIKQSERNDLTSANPVAIVRINLHTKRNTTGV